MPENSKRVLKQVLWDIEPGCSEEEIYLFIKGEKDIQGLDRNKITARMLGAVRWYEIIDIFGIDKAVSFLNPVTLGYLWPETLKKRFENVSKILSGTL